MGKRKFLSILLSVCMVLTFMPQMVFAARAGGSYTVIDGTAGAVETEGPGSLIDGKYGKKWCVTNFSSAYIIFSTASKVNVSGYSITTGNDNAENKGRNPKNWTLYGCNDSSAGRNSASWIPIHSVTNDIVLKNVNNTTYNFAFDNNGTEYQYYKLEITAVQSGDVMQMSEFELVSCNHSWSEPVTTAPTCTTAGDTTKACTVCNGIDSVYLKPVDHDFTGEGGACIYCHYTYDELQQFCYLDKDGILRQLGSNQVRVIDASTEWTTNEENDFWYIALGDVKIENSVTVSGDVHLIIADGCNLIVNGDITVGNIGDGRGYNLTIYGQAGGSGTLVVNGNIIGGNGELSYSISNPGGNISINGGTITATGSIIGGKGGNYGNDDGKDGGKGGNITINSGTVRADSIIGGEGGDTKDISLRVGGGNGGDVDIKGGTVETVRISGGQGGDGSNRSASGGNVNISGGVVKVDSIAGGTGGNGGPSGIGSSGTFSTETNGNAVIFASSIDGYESESNSWSGVIFVGNEGKVYGSTVTPTEDFTIESDKTLTIENGKTLAIPDNKMLSIEEGGTLTIENGGILTNNGKIYVDGTFTGTAGNLYYPLTLVNATANENTSEYNSKNYGKAGSTITLSAASQVGKIITWESSPKVDISGNRFIMPKAALEITAQWIECKHKGETEIRNVEAATCTKEGYSGDEYCLLCNAMIAKGGATDMSAHKLNHIPKTDATITETGNKEYWQCKDCKKYFSDVAGTTVISDLESWKAGEGKIDKLTIPSKTDSVTSGKDGSVTVTLDKSVSSSGGKTTAKVTDSVANTILTKLASSESKSVVINSAAGSNAAAEPGTSTLVTISESAVKKLAEVEGIEITLVTDNGKVVLDSKTLSAVASKAGDDGQVAFIIDTVERGGSILKVELKIQTSGGDVTGFDGGKVTVTVGIDDELKGRNPVCVYIDEEDIYHKIGGMLNDDGTFTFVTGHFSTYAIMLDADADAVIKEQTAAAQKAAIKNVKTTVTLSTKEVKRGIRVTVKVPENQKADKTGIIIYRSTKKDAKPYAVYKKVEMKGSTYIIRNYYNVKGNRLVKGKTYYYKARAYKVIDGKTYYGPMSTIKAIKAK